VKAFALILAFAALAHAQAPWPASVAAENYDVKVVAPFSANMAATYASPHFLIPSEMKLPLGVVRDLAAVFESTRAAVRAVPLGFAVAAEPKQYLVRLCATVESYSQAGGAPGTGGMFDGHELLILLPNLGIKPTTNGLGAEHTKHLFVLKHETVHLVTAPAHLPLPPWLNEGLAETFAAAPYVRGRYTFTGLDSAMRDYLLKWRGRPDSRTLRLIAPGRLLALTTPEWQREVGAQNAYDLYNSAALLTHWFLHYDGKGDSAGLAAYLDALRTDTSPSEAAQKHLLRGRTPEQIATELKNLTRRMALDGKWD
jgi:hypothetical protein